jgi:hypothetical protein
MLKNILDFKAVNCIRDRVFEGYRESGNIIFNKNSKISKDIKEYEDELNKSTAEFYPIAVNGLKYYRSDKKELLVSLIDILKDKKKKLKRNLVKNHEENLKKNLEKNHEEYLEENLKKNI